MSQGFSFLAFLNFVLCAYLYVDVFPYFWKVFFYDFVKDLAVIDFSLVYACTRKVWFSTVSLIPRAFLPRVLTSSPYIFACVLCFL